MNDEKQTKNVSFEKRREERRERTQTQKQKKKKQSLMTQNTMKKIEGGCFSLKREIPFFLSLCTPQKMRSSLRAKEARADENNAREEEEEEDERETSGRAPRRKAGPKSERGGKASGSW